MIVMVLLSVMLAQTASAPVDFSGTYEATMAANKALTESKGLEYRIGGGGLGPATGQPPAPTQRTMYFVTQTASTLTIERRIGPSTTRTVYKLDGSESVNTSSISSTRTRASWKGRSLVISGTMSMEVNGGDLVETTVVSTYTRMSNGDIHVETRSKRADSDERVNWLALVRQQ